MTTLLPSQELKGVSPALAPHALTIVGTEKANRVNAMTTIAEPSMVLGSGLPGKMESDVAYSTSKTASHL
jgi:hypothetical protein